MMRIVSDIILIQIFIYVIYCVPQSDPAIVHTAFGPVKGIVGKDYRSFKGIPYAASPSGDRRWASPEPRKSWGPNTLDATKFQAGCPQKCDLIKWICPATTSEDCLYLNIYTPLPTGNATHSLPVMVFIHGGTFLYGSPGVYMYEGNNFVAKGDVILVTIAYRLGALGWLATNELEGNFGFQDQIFALKWIKANIKAFGGNPDLVTIFGQSAGAISVTAHLMSPYSRGLFHRAVIESNPAAIPMKGKEDAEYYGKVYYDSSGCDYNDIKCLRALSVEDVLKAQDVVRYHISITRILETFVPWTPVTHSKHLPMHQIEAFATGEYNDVPIMAGTCKNDARLFIYLAAKFELNDVEYAAVASFFFLSQAPEVLERYPPRPVFGDKRPQLSFAATQYIFQCPTRNIIEDAYDIQGRDISDDIEAIYDDVDEKRVRKMEQFIKLRGKSGVDVIAHNQIPSKHPRFLYQFAHPPSFNAAWGQKLKFCWGYVCHGSELPFLFDPNSVDGIHPTANEVVLSNELIRYWTNFARNGDPNNDKGKLWDWKRINERNEVWRVNESSFSSLYHDHLDGKYYTWPAWNNQTRSYMIFNTPKLEIASNFDGNNCDFWDTEGYHWGW